MPQCPTTASIILSKLISIGEMIEVVVHLSVKWASFPSAIRAVGNNAVTRIMPGALLGSSSPPAQIYIINYTTKVEGNLNRQRFVARHIINTTYITLINRRDTDWDYITI